MQTLFAAALIALAASVLAGQEPQREQKLKNLQFFPVGTTHDEIVPPMREMTEAIGAKDCEYCHVSGRGELDDKVEKRTARAMLRLVADLNAKLDSELGPTGDGSRRVRCVTCHRGVAIPIQLNELVTRVAAQSGMPSAIGKYRELRKQYFGGQSYDFGEQNLVALARDLTANGKSQEAVDWLRLNLEFYPQSASTHLGLSQAEARRNNMTAALSAARKALEIEPQNAAARRQLENLTRRP